MIVGTESVRVVAVLQTYGISTVHCRFHLSVSTCQKAHIQATVPALDKAGRMATIVNAVSPTLWLLLQLAGANPRKHNLRGSTWSREQGQSI